MARTRIQRLNLLGIVSILIGIAAFISTKFSIAGYGPIPIALLGLGIGLLAFLASVTTGRWSSGVAVLGMLVSAGALVLAGYNNGTLPGWWAKVHPSPEPPPAVIKPAPVPAPALPEAPSGPHLHSIFDTDNSAPTPPTPYHLAPPSSVIPASPPVVTTPAHAAEPVTAQPSTPTLGEARAKLDAATADVEHSLANDPAYVAASAEVAAADEKRKAALAEAGPGSPAVLDAGTQWLDAKSKLKKLVDAAAAKDPAVQAARRELSEAEAQIRASKSPGGK